MTKPAKAVQFKPAQIQRRHWEQLAEDSGVDHTWSAMPDMAEILEPALSAVQGWLPADFSMEMAEKVFAGARKHLANFNHF